MCLFKAKYVFEWRKWKSCQGQARSKDLKQYFSSEQFKFDSSNIPWNFQVLHYGFSGQISLASKSNSESGSDGVEKGRPQDGKSGNRK